MRQGLRFLHTELPNILPARCDVLSSRMVRIIEELAGDWHRLDERIESLSADIKALADQDPACDRLMSVPEHDGRLQFAAIGSCEQPCLAA